MKNESSYSLINKNIKSLSKTILNLVGDPIEVSQLVLRVTLSNSPKLRYQPGIKNKIIWKAYHLIPKSIFEKLIISKITQ